MAEQDGSGTLSRRDFLKWSGVGLFGLTLSFTHLDRLLNQDREYGRVIDPSIDLHEIPSFSGKITSRLYQDHIFPITTVTVGDGNPAYNRVWYQLRADGFAHSGNIQPVSIHLNEPVRTLPDGGQLGEVTVPFTDALREADPKGLHWNRLYFGTTYWIVSAVPDPAGMTWYGLLDDRAKMVFYVQAKHIRLIPPAELNPLSPQVPPEKKRIEVQLDRQLVVAYEWDRPVFMTRAATGARFASGNFTTDPGHYTVYRKSPTRHMASGDRAAADSFNLPGVPWVSFITEDGISFHGTYWHNNFGIPRSHGCVNVSIPAAKWIYLWTNPIVPAGTVYLYEKTGTAVDVIGQLA